MSNFEQGILHEEALKPTNKQEAFFRLCAMLMEAWSRYDSTFLRFAAFPENPMVDRMPNIENSRFVQRLIRYFLAGVFAVLPLVITVLAVSWVINLLAGLIGPETFLGDLLSKLGARFVDNTTVAYIVGWISVLVAIFALGFLVETGMRRLFSQIAEAFFRRVPLVGKVYDASKQIVDMLDKQGDDKLKGMGVVYCTFGEKGGAGVLALLPTPEKSMLNGREHYVVLVPQSPVPIGGGLLFVPVESVSHVDMSVDVFMSIYVSMGVTVPKMMRDINIRKAIAGGA
ncbi:DUF502 domain-containing protein [Novipirellula artificiosorum]|uniref:DUF502 domain-containing protein n=1 Tax=Novipirellula artificiosorum TaxID=2528016 RepID=A0A5C6D4K1_9BACT|nr:DUF502 domain-containing protein [Novipirellula artificiosorum]TWU30844.1 hypothetical protein Poly41_65380 [Novipirellula artificiosorum]